jgi:hypothetical protein
MPVKVYPKLAEWGFRFIKLANYDKVPVEPDYYTFNHYVADDPRLIQWLENQRGNYGVVPRVNQCILDADIKPLADFARGLSGLNDTLEVQTGRINGEGTHFYFLTDASRVAPLYDPESLTPGRKPINIGHLKGYGGYAVGPGSYHPSGGRYTVENEPDELPFIPFSDVLDHFKEYRKETLSPPIVHTSGRIHDAGIDIPIDRVWMPINPVHRGAHEIQGSHPVHGSDSGMNFSINTRDNVWHCWRCDTGGGVASAIAIVHGLIDCSDAGPGALRGDLYKEVLKIARDVYRWEDPRIKKTSGLTTDIDDLTDFLRWAE